MKKNMGLIDRITRLVIAIGLIIFYLTGVTTGIWGIVLLALAAIFVVTSLVSVCPLYLPFGLSTLRNKNKVNAGDKHTILAK